MVLPLSVQQAIDKLETAGFEAWVVGGAVRDMLRGKQPSDYDLCTNALPEQMKSVFQNETIIETGIKHGTLTLLTEDFPLEITTYRTDGAYTDSRHPDGVQFVSEITQDLARRDFTMNAIAFHPKRGVLDPFGGKDDIARRTIRAVGDANVRFEEDALRIMRAIRFSSQTGFSVGTKTKQAMICKKEKLLKIAAERIQKELILLLCGRFVCSALRSSADVLTTILPEILPMIGCNQQNPHHKYDVWEHTIHAVGNVPAEPFLRLAMLLHDIGKPACKTIDENGIGHFYGHPAKSVEIARNMLNRLKCSNEIKRAALLLVEKHDAPLALNRKMVRRRLAQMGEENVRALLMVKKGDRVGQETNPKEIDALLKQEALINEVCAENACLSLKQLAVDGNDLRQIGLSGKEIGGMLKIVFEAVLEEQIPNEKAEILSFIRRNMEESK